MKRERWVKTAGSQLKGRVCGEGPLGKPEEKREEEWEEKAKDGGLGCGRR